MTRPNKKTSMAGIGVKGSGRRKPSRGAKASGLVLDVPQKCKPEEKPKSEKSRAVQKVEVSAIGNCDKREKRLKPWARMSRRPDDEREDDDRSTKGEVSLEGKGISKPERKGVRVRASMQGGGGGGTGRARDPSLGGLRGREADRERKVSHKTRLPKED